ncbi:uncharacterized protein LOC135394967 isoform X2 [Ornithodoros turicata]|uniref:uncharacterized protein LOC135394967 isoform X2 n=1 Tax=Ornithodoros turicata TaxID=34597 RepID=UPI003138F00A
MKHQRAASETVILCCVCFLLVHLESVEAHRNRTEGLPVVFPDDNESVGGSTRNGGRGRPSTRVNNPQHQTHSEIPDSLLYRMRNVRNLTDFVSQFLDGYNELGADDSSGELPSILGKKGPGAVNIPDPEPGNCMPTKQLVEFPKPTDPSTILWPPCTRVTRCGGCCPSAILTCTPTKTTNMTYKVIKAQYPKPGATKFNFIGHEIVTLERHDRCGCECKQKPSDCNRMQRYEECRCLCRNTADMENCQGASVVWDHTVCRCMCRDYSECSTGFYYNPRSCKCETLRRARLSARVLPLPKLVSPYTDNRESEQTRNHFLDMAAHDDVPRHLSPLQLSSGATSADHSDLRPNSTSIRPTVASPASASSRSLRNGR